MRAITVTILALFAVAFGSWPAYAGGPTSVLVGSPATRQAAALYHDEAAYRDLMRIVTGGEAVPAEEAHTQDGRHINVTWLAHDTSVWRIDRIYLDAPGGPQVRTELELRESGSEPVRRVAEPGELHALLNDLGLLENSAPDRPASGDAAVGDRPASGDAAVDRVAATRITDPGGKPWEWGIGGLVAGALLALGTGWLRQRWLAR